MDIAFLLHLYQPPTQSEKLFREIAKSSYLPLVRAIKEFKNFKVSLNLPLSLLEQMDNYGYDAWIDDIKEFVKAERVELVGSAAYHPILTKLPQDVVEKQIVLNEFGLGYYFGRHTGFEGEKAVLIRNLTGFFPPELAVNENIVAILDSLAYSWVLVDGTAIPDDPGYYPKYGVYKLKDYATKIVCRNRIFSNMLAFKRDLDMDEITNAINFFEANDKSFVVVLDAEFFGHHYDAGFTVLGNLLESLTDMGINIVTIGEYLSAASTTNLWQLRESSWGASDTDMTVGEMYPLWAHSKNAIHKLQWEIQNKLLKVYQASLLENEVEGYETLPIWVPQKLQKLANTSEKESISLDLLVQKSLHSDQFWWASGKGLPTGQTLYDPEMVRKGLSLTAKAATMIGDESFIDFMKEKSAEIEKLL
jgi:predicted glycosyl hydrolase (DUF1957 family)